MMVLLKSHSRWRLRQSVQILLAATGIFALAYCAGDIVKARFFQSSESTRFNAALEGGVKAPPVIANSPPHDGTVLGQLSIPRLELAVMVVEGVEQGDLKRAVGHIPGTALPGEKGNLALAGHRDTFFRPLRLIRLGDTITLRTLATVYRYRVVATKVVEPDDVGVLDPDGSDTLTLVTCFPFYYVGPAPKRFIIKADRLSGARSADEAPTLE